MKHIKKYKLFENSSKYEIRCKKCSYHAKKSGNEYQIFNSDYDRIYSHGDPEIISDPAFDPIGRVKKSDGKLIFTFNKNKNTFDNCFKKIKHEKIKVESIEHLLKYLTKYKKEHQDEYDNEYKYDTEV